MHAVLASLSQLAFVGTPSGGLIVLLSLALISPWVAGLAALGAGFGTALGWAGGGDRPSLLSGLSGYNAAVVALFSAGAFATGQGDPGLLLVSLTLCVAIETLCRAAFERIGLPPLILPAVLTLWIVSAALAPRGGWLWLDPPLSSVLAPPLSIGLVFCAMALSAWRAAALAVVAALAAAVLSVAWFDQPALSLFGFWSLNVPLAAFAVAGVFIHRSLLALIFGVGAAALAGLLWALWWSFGGPLGLPPLTAPYMLAVWIALLAARQLAASPLTQAGLWRAAAVMALAGWGKQRVAVIMEAGLPWDPSLPPRFWTWLDPNLPVEAYATTGFRDSARVRRAVWEACDRLRRHPAERRRVPDVEGVSVLDADPRALHDPRPAGYLALRGGVEGVACLDCGAAVDWPPRGVWRVADLHCPTCNGFLKPRVDLGPPSAASVPALAECRILVLCGPPSGDPAVAALLTGAQARGATVVQLLETGFGYPAEQNAPAIYGEPQRRLAAILAVLRLARRARSWHLTERGWRSTWRRTTAVGSGVALAATLVFWSSASLPMRASPSPVPVQDVQIPSYTGTWDDIRTGRYRAAPVLLPARLHRPAPSDMPPPAVVLLHGSDGELALQAAYAARLAAAGFTALVVDSFRPRGVESTIGAQTAVSAYSMTIDAYQALHWLAEQGGVDAGRIAVVGWSKGGLAADLASRAWYRAHLARIDRRFAAHAAFYPWCGEQTARPHQTGAPILFLLGERDEWTGHEECRRHAERLRDAGFPAKAVVFRDAHHGFDAAGAFKRYVHGAEAVGACAYHFEPTQFRDLNTGEVWPWSSFDGYLAACGRSGAHVGSNAVARRDAWQELAGFLGSVLGQGGPRNGH